MQKFLLNRRSWMLALLAGTMPLATVGTCDLGPGGGSFFLDQGSRYGDGVVFVDAGRQHGGFFDVFIDDGYYYEDDVFYDDVYYDDYYYDDYYCDPYFWDCW